MKALLTSLALLLLLPSGNTAEPLVRSRQFQSTTKLEALQWQRDNRQKLFELMMGGKQGHCPCWNFPGLEQHFDFADIFACVAPRPLVLELGEKERAPGGFPVEIGRKASAEIQAAYHVFGAENEVQLDVHPAGHVFHGVNFWKPLRDALGMPRPESGTPKR